MFVFCIFYLKKEESNKQVKENIYIYIENHILTLLSTKQKKNKKGAKIYNLTS